MKKKQSLAIAMALTIGVSVQFVQPGNLATGNVAQIVGMQSAEAGFGLPKIKTPKIKTPKISAPKIKMPKAVGNDVAKSATSKVSNIVGNMLNFDMEGATKHQNSMVTNLQCAMLLDSLAYANLADALGHNPEKVAALNDAKKFRSSSAFAIKGVKSSITAETAHKFQKDVEKLTPEQLNSAELKRLTKESINQRTAAGFFRALAARDAIFIVKESSKALAKKGSLGDKADSIKNLFDTAKTAQSLMKGQSAISKELRGVHSQLSSRMKMPKETKATPAFAQEMLNKARG